MRERKLCVDVSHPQAAPRFMANLNHVSTSAKSLIYKEFVVKAQRIAR